MNNFVFENATKVYFGKGCVGENLDLFDFSLSDDDIEKLKVIDEDKSLWCAYDDPMIVEYAMS